MNIFRTKIITILIIYSLFIGTVMGGILYFVRPSFSINWFVSILLFFTVMETGLLLLVEGYSRNNKKQLLNVYMLTKIIKFIAACCFVLLYILTDKTDIKSFIAVFISFYLLFLFSETFLFTRIEKHIKATEKER